MMRTMRLLNPVLLVGMLVALTRTVSADPIFALIPADGNVSGPPGAFVGWGYSLTNADLSNWFVSTNLNSDSFSNGTPVLLFDFPILPPGGTATEAFNPVSNSGLFKLQWDVGAPVGFVNNGNFTLSGEWWDGDPLNGGTFIANAPDVLEAYSATVSPSGVPDGVPEPSSLFLVLIGIFVLLLFRLANKRRAAFAVTLCAVCASYPALCQSASGTQPERENEPGITRRQADEILNELRGIRKLLERPAIPPMPAQMPVVPQTGKLRLEGGYTFGSNGAPVTIVEFTDYQGRFCRQFHDTTFAELRKNYIDKGLVRFVIRDFPLVDSHPDAMRAAEAARCAGDQGQFLAMHDALFGDPGKLAQSGLIDYAKALKLDVPAFQSCLEGGRHKAEIQNDIQIASSLQINGTPSFLIGKIQGEEVSGTIVIGAQLLDVFETKIKQIEVAR